MHSPFMLQSRLSYTQMGVFSVAAYPYSLKLLWSPVVDALYWPRFGRRKSWVVPVQLACALLLALSAGWIEARYLQGQVVPLTVLFFFFVLLAATQDIAVDGWALTLLRPPHVEYAATCQTLGMNVGYFTSFTVFLALENAAFCDAHLRPRLGWPLDPTRGVVTLAGYVRFWGWFFAAATAAIALFKKEGREQEGGDLVEGVEAEEEEAAACLTPRATTMAMAAPMTTTTPMATPPRRAQKRGGGRGGGGTKPHPHRARALPALRPSWQATVRAAYKSLYGVVRLPAVWMLTSVLVTYRLGVLPAEGAAALKLLDKGGASKEALAALVLVQFPIELLSALLAGRWAARASPHAPFLAGYAARLAASAMLTLLVAAFPAAAGGGSGGGGGAGGASAAAAAAAASWPWFAALAVLGLLQSFASTLMFTALGSFFNRISDPAMGGAYLTLLNTIANMGVVLPKTPVFALIDALTVVRCHRRQGGGGRGGEGALGAGAGAAGFLLSSSSSSSSSFSGSGSIPSAWWSRAWAALGTWAGGGGPRVQALAAAPLLLSSAAQPLVCPGKPREYGGASDACAAAGGACVVHVDGFYLVSGVAVVGGVALLALVHARLFRQLVALPAESWRVGGGGGGGGVGGASTAARGSAAAVAATRKKKA
jgi:MFS transporter, PAT family, solute carrier family 33 (acetyl-CoA transportor), member 1